VVEPLVVGGRRTVAGGRAAAVVQEMRGREGLVLHIHSDEAPANAVKSQACFVGSRIAMPGG
jgi:hypothetical protein